MAIGKKNVKKLIKLGDLLCASFTVTEAQEVLARELSRLFPGGAYYRFHPGRELLEMEFSWGHPPRLQVFAHQDCHAVRRNRPHLVAGASKGLPCRHLEGEEVDGVSVCVTVSAHGELMGLLHIRLADANAPAREVERAQQLALLATQQVRLALKNLRLREELANQSARDPLTGLVNRRFLEGSLERELRKAEREGKTVGVIFVDIDYLGRINQTYGIEEGERIIKDLAGFLAENAGDRDIVCRWGADEFVVILPDRDLPATVRYAENLRSHLKEKAQGDTSRHLKRITLSMGAAASPLHGQIAWDILQSVRGAVKRAKTEGRDRVCVPL